MADRKMHAEEVHTDAALVRRLLEGQFPQWAELPIERVPSTGTDNALYRLGDDLVARLPRIHWAVGSVAKDLRWLPLLAPLLPVEIPVPLAKGLPAEGYPWEWGVYPWLAGANPTVGGIPDAEALARELAQFVAAVRRIDLADPPPAGRAVLAMREEETRAAIAELRGTIDTHAAATVWEAALQTAATSRPSGWIHGDLMPGNLLLQSGRLAGVIDWGGVGIGDPACDVMPAWTVLPAEVRNDFRDELGVDETTWIRGRGWALSVGLVALPYYEETNPRFAAVARHVIAEVLADHAGGP